MMEQAVRTIIKHSLGKRTKTITRFPTGLSHFVYDVVTEDNFPCVVRIARPERKTEFMRGLTWHKAPAAIGVPLPEIYQRGAESDPVFAVYERLPGTDLEAVYPALTAQEKKEIAHTVAGIQQTIHTLDPHHFEPTFPKWIDLLHTIVARSEREIVATKLCDRRYVDRVRAQLQKHLAYFGTLQPVPFLYDLNVRNVIVHKGKVTGIIDVDDLWLGDPLLAIGRGKTLLLMMRQDTKFISHWCDYLNLSPFQLQMVDFYALLYCLRFMGTIGFNLNGNQNMQTDPQIGQHLERIADQLLAK